MKYLLDTNTIERRVGITDVSEGVRWARLASPYESGRQAITLSPALPAG
jgi:hypothetical protein